MNTIYARAALAAVLTGLAGCGGSAPPPAPAPALQPASPLQLPGQDSAKLEQRRLCEVSGWRRDVVAKACKTGEKIVFLPESFGNEQLPVIFAAVNCDLRYQVALTRGAVTCIYSPIDAPAEQQVEASPGTEVLPAAK